MITWIIFRSVDEAEFERWSELNGDSGLIVVVRKRIPGFRPSRKRRGWAVTNAVNASVACINY